MKSLTWKQTIKLGKKVVMTRLQQAGIKFNVKEHYFRLCSLLYKFNQQADKVVSLIAKKVEKAKEATEKATNAYDYMNSLADQLTTELTALKV